MILLFIGTLLGLGDCNPGGSGLGYGDYKDVIDLKGPLVIGQYDQKPYHVPYIVSKKDDKQYELDDKKDDSDYNKSYDDDKYDNLDDYVYDKNKRGFDIRKYDYVQKCNIINKDCSDGRDCYDKANDRGQYDKCKDQYGDEGRYYDYNDRFIGIRYREDDYYDRNDKDCYEKSKNEGDYEKCRQRYDGNNDYDKDCYDNSKDRDDYENCRNYYRRCRNNYGRRYNFRILDWRNDRDCDREDGNLVGLGRRDREDYLIRPCALDDRQCIRKYLAENSNCKPAYGPIPDPLYLKRNTLYLPFANITVVRTRLRVTGLASIKISEFYVNKDTKNLVIALDFQKLNMTCPRTYFRYKRTAKESIVLDDYATIEYQSGTFTAVIPKIPKLRLDLAEVHADIDDLQPPFFIGPKALASTDPDVIAAVAKLVTDPVTTTQESFLFQSQLYTAIYIQENLCDFGLKLVSV